MENLNITSKAVLAEISEISFKAKQSQFAPKAKAAKKDYTTIIAVSILSLVPIAVICAKYIFNVDFSAMS